MLCVVGVSSMFFSAKENMCDSSEGGRVEFTNGLEDKPSYAHHMVMSLHRSMLIVIHITVSGIFIIGAEFRAA
jgi:hypothetical protein